MKNIIKKIVTGRDGRRTADAAMKSASLSARDQLAYAAALKILG